MEGFLLFLRRKLIFTLWKGGSVIVFSHAMNGKSSEAALLLASLCIGYITITTPYRRASDNRQDFLSINRN